MTRQEEVHKENKIMTREQFKALSGQEQWNWVVENKHLVRQIDLDNDGTWVQLVGNDEYYLTMHEYCGYDEGVQMILKSIGLNAHPV